MRSADKMDNVKPRLYMIKKHEEEKDAVLGRSGTVWAIGGRSWRANS